MMTISRRVIGVVEKLTLAAILISLLAVYAAPKASAQSVSGSGSWVSNSSVDGSKEGTWQLSATKDDTGLSGSFSASGPSDFARGNVFGAFGSGGDIHFGILYDDVEEADFSGTVVGAVASGTYTTANGDSGRWVGSFGPAAQ
jgi:hypothetical protein